MTTVTPITANQAQHIEQGDDVEVRFATGWTTGWTLHGIQSRGTVSVERVEDGALLTSISPDRIRKVAS